jgi:NAD(P)-dependent dehydrogenase (short-subunit alcohol dehydrogenase family)
MSRLDISDRVALVTGAAGNIGEAICHALRQAGAIVCATDRQPDQERAIAPLDVTSEVQWRAAIERVEASHGRLDILINNAGVAPMAHVVDTTIDAWRRCFAINVEGALIGMKAALPLLRRSDDRPGGASIVNVASAAANKPSPMAAAYCSSKAALVMLSRTAAVEFGRLGYGVRVNTVNPGAVESAMIDGIVARYSQILKGESEDALKSAMRADVPLGRLARPDDVADAVLYLASSASRFVHGTELHIDGGLTA